MTGLVVVLPAVMTALLELGAGRAVVVEPDADRVGDLLELLCDQFGAGRAVPGAPDGISEHLRRANGLASVSASG